MFLIQNGYVNENQKTSDGFLRLVLDFWGKHLRFVCISMGQRKEMRSGTKNVWQIEISLLIFCCVFLKK